MRQIIPFKKDLLFKTKVSEITSISLEHHLAVLKENIISGEFEIIGDYKMTEASINRESFSFKIPFDIELDGSYDPKTIKVDIDNFYYEVINNEILQVNIDLYMDGEKIETPPIVEKKEPSLEAKAEKREEENTNFKELMDISFPTKVEKDTEKKKEELEEPTSIRKNLEPTKEESQDNIEDLIKDKEIISNKNFNIFENIDDADTYVTYHVYIVKEQDTIDTIISKYNTTKEKIMLYNQLDEIKPGMKLIIPNEF